MSKALKIGVPVAIVVAIAVVAFLFLSAPTGQKEAPPTASPGLQGVTRAQIEGIPPASRTIQVTNLLGSPERSEEARLASEVPLRTYLYYPVQGSERSQVWELAFEEGRLAETDRCASRVLIEEGGGACSQPSRE